MGGGATGRVDTVASDLLRLPNIVLRSHLGDPEPSEDWSENRLALALLLGAVGQQIGEAAEALCRLRLGGHLLDHLPVIRRRAEQLSVEIDYYLRLELYRIAKVLHRDFWTFWHADVVEHEQRRLIVGSRALELIDQIFGIAQIGEIGRCGNDHMVGAEHDLLSPSR